MKNYLTKRFHKSKSGPEVALLLHRICLMLILCFTVIGVSVISLTGCKEKKQAETASVKADVYYTCSMHPQVHAERPGNCPICGMKLIAVSKTSMSTAAEVHLTSEQITLGNIHVDTMRNESIGDKLVLTGILNFNQNGLSSVSTRTEGRIQKLYFKNIGDYVQKGDKIYDLYSEQLNNAKQEYKTALEQESIIGNSLINYNAVVQSAKNKLLLWGLSESQVEELNGSKEISPLTSFYSPASGYITTLNIQEGDYAMEGGTIFTLADLSTLWAEAQVYTAQLSELDKSGTASVQVPYMPGREFKGTIEHVNPEINPDTRINLIRVAIPNTDHSLKPGMPVYVVINSTQHKSFTLPLDAVLRDSKGAVVWVRTNHNTFTSRMVQTGLETGDRIEILSGVKPGDVVVTSGAYLLNSEYKFKTGNDPMAGMKM